ncbi:MAG: ATP-binding protein [Candidatus Babeliales bacterium]
MTRQDRKKNKKTGQLRIGDDWNAITIIALSQNNPLKAIAEFVENSIDAQAANVTIIRGKERGQSYLKIIDDGSGIPCTIEGTPDFKYVATHICDSLKRRIKKEGLFHIQGEFGIGLMSFWTVGHKLSMVSSGKDGKTYVMEMEKGRPGYSVVLRPRLLPVKGTQLTIAPLLQGIRFLNGEKIQRYLASELRDRIRHSGVKIKIMDRVSRCEYDVEPRQFEGRLIHGLQPVTAKSGGVYVELYLYERNPENRISLYRAGTRLLPDISSLEFFQCEPWTSGYFQGVIDAPFLHLTPGTRDGVIHDEWYAEFCDVLAGLKERLGAIVMEQQKSEDERMSKNILRSVHRALRDALLNLPAEEYDWFALREKRAVNAPGGPGSLPQQEALMAGLADIIDDEKPKAQKEFFEIAGPLFSARIQPASTLVQAGKAKSFRAVGLDRRKLQTDQGLVCEWSISEGAGQLDKNQGEAVTFTAASEPGLSRLKAIVRQGEVVCEAECVITVVDQLIKTSGGESDASRKGLPGYTLEGAAGQMWRSRYDEKRNIVIINSGHRDFVYAGKERIRKLRYISRLFSKELILQNFLGESPPLMLERLVELSLYIEENLK